MPKELPMIKKGIIGGTFDPIHNGHLYIAYEAMYRLNLNKVIFMPSGNPPHKTDKKITDGLVRYELVQDAVKNEEMFEVCDFEIKKESYSYTFETMRHFKEKEPATEWFFITGADCLRDLHKWKRVDSILDSCTLVVFNRPGQNKEQLLKEKAIIEAKYNKEIVFLDLLQLEISSSNIREAIKIGRNVSYFLPEPVYNKILRLNLYRNR
jgi:nicotinate-nucleotide adenylyltransferase